MKWSHSVMSDSLRPHGLWPIRLFCPRDFPGKSAGVGCHFLLQGIFPTQELNAGLPHCGQTLYHLSHQGVCLVLIIVLGLCEMLIFGEAGDFILKIFFCLIFFLSLFFSSLFLPPFSFLELHCHIYYTAWYFTTSPLFLYYINSIDVSSGSQNFSLVIFYHMLSRSTDFQFLYSIY